MSMSMSMSMSVSIATKAVETSMMMYVNGEVKLRVNSCEEDLGPNMKLGWK